MRLQAEYEPTPEEIEEGKARIQAGWSDRTRQKRAGGKPKPYTIATDVETFVTASRNPDLYGILTGKDSWGLV